MDSKLVIIIAIVAAAAVGGGVYYYFAHDNGSTTFSPNAYPDTYLTVLGNANLDNQFSQADADAIQNFITSGNPYEYKDYYMYDANFDGVIDQKDVDKVNAIVTAVGTADPTDVANWADVGKVFYVNVDKKIVSYDMTKTNKVITLIAPPLDSVLAMGGKNLVVGFDSRIEASGKYYPEYANTLNYTNPYLVGSCNDPLTEVISQAASDLGAINVVCGNSGSYGPNMESTFEGTNVQIIRIASWEYGETLYGFMTLGFLLKMNDGAQAYLTQYETYANQVKTFIESIPAATKESIGAAVAYGYDMESNEIKLLGISSGEYANLMTLQPYDSGESYLNGAATAGHGNLINGETVAALYTEHNLKRLILMIGTPFQVKAGSGNAQSTQAAIEAFYAHWESALQLSKVSMPNLDYCIAGYSFSSGVSEVLNRLVLAYYLYPGEFIDYFGSGNEETARNVIKNAVNWYCGAIGIDGKWSFDGTEGSNMVGMNLLYCGSGDHRNIMYGPASGANPENF